MKEYRITSVSAVRVISSFRLNRTDSGLVGLFGRDRSDPAAHAKHQAQAGEPKQNDKFATRKY